MNDLPLGEFRDMPAADYFAVKAMSNSAMKELARSPWHYKNRVSKTPTRRLMSGTLAHCAVLEPDAMSARYVVTPEDAPRRPSAAQWNAKKSSPESEAAKSWWTSFNASLEGREVISHDEYELTKAQLQAVLAVPELSGLLSSGYAETSVFWIDEATGVYCKARPDWVHPLSDGRVILLDLKTAADESPPGFAKSVASFGYHRQDAHYRAGFEAATGKQVAAFIFAAVTSAAPVLAVPYHLDDQAANQGAEEVAELLALFAQCQRTGIWPAYGEGYQAISLPRWAQRNTEVEVSFV